MTAEPAATGSAVEHVLAETWPVLLDFDGPVTYFYADGRNRLVSDRIRQALPGSLDVPAELRDTLDPLVLLRWTAMHTRHEVAARVDQVSTAGELDCAAVADPTPGAVDFLEACRQVGRPVVIVSNNAEPAIVAFLDRHDLRHLVHAIVGRVPARPELMKPHPDSVIRTLDLLDRPAAECVLIGDSVTDIEVSRATGLRSIGYAKTPTRGHELHLAGADAITDSNRALAEFVRRGTATA